MNRRDFVKLAATGAASAGMGLSAQGKRPNIIIMLADDMGFSDLGCYGSEIRTPNLDAMAGAGVRFTHFRNTARCCPSRSSLLTGLYAHQAGVGHMVNPRPGLPGYQGDLNHSCVTIAQVMKQSGYQTMMTGKWHVTPNNGKKHNWPLQRGFDRYFGIIAGAASYYQPWTLTRDNTPIEAEGNDFYLTDAIGQNAAQYIEDAAKKPEPFFLYTAFTSPHWPLHAFESDIELLNEVATDVFLDPFIEDAGKKFAVGKRLNRPVGDLCGVIERWLNEHEAVGLRLGRLSFNDGNELDESAADLLEKPVDLERVLRVVAVYNSESIEFDFMRFELVEAAHDAVKCRRVAFIDPVMIVEFSRSVNRNAD